MLVLALYLIAYLISENEIHSFYSVVLNKQKLKAKHGRHPPLENLYSPTSVLPDEGKSMAAITPGQADTQAIEMKGFIEKP